MKYDAVIVGASIAGLYAGMKLAQGGWNVAIFDRKKEIGLPVRCGEATGSREELSRFMTVEEDWIACDVKGMKFHCDGASPFTLDTPGRAVMLRRDRFEKALAAKAMASGARVILNAVATGLRRDGRSPDGAFDGVFTEGTGLIEASLIIGADGCESKLGRWAGITRHVPPHEAFPSVQYRLKSDVCDDGYLHFFTGSGVIPRGYIWVFPKGRGRVSAGAGLYGCHNNGEKPSVLLDRFVEKNMPGAAREERITGCVPLSVCPKKLFRNNVMVVGDAGRQANPLTAGGIMNALEAADCAVKELLKNGPGKDHFRPLQKYSRKWAKQRFNQKVFYWTKEVFVTLDDKEIQAVVEAASKSARGPVRANRPFSFTLPHLLRLGIVFSPLLGRYCRVRWKKS